MKPRLTFGWIIALEVIIALIIGGIVAGRNTSGGGETGLTKVTVMLDWTPNTNHAGIYLAKERSWYRDAGLDVTIIEPGETGVDQVVAAGKAQFGISVAENVIPARAQGVPVVSIAAIIQHNTSSLLSLREDGITRPRDLAGKTYGGFGGPLETQLIKTLVSCDGGDANAVKFVEAGNVDYFVGMQRNLYDFVWIFDAWDGIRAREVERIPVNTLPFIDYTRCIPDWYTPVIITNEEMTKKQPDLVRRFMEATSRGYQRAMSQPEEAARVLLQVAPELDPKLVQGSAAYLATRYVDGGRRWGLQDEAVWSRFAEFLRTAGLVDRTIDVKPAYTNEFLPGG
ncbi:MAG: ABC transporter substrate-binding protein [Dehalococcoidia bacterium]|nr:ABC transporter substrate-binding protein [Dehalococcoidia bacterium]